MKMSVQEKTGKRTMEQLQFIVPKLSKLLNRDLDIMKFHQECASVYPRLSYAMEVLHALKPGDKVPFNIADVYIENLAKELTKIRYIPEVISRDEFLYKLTEDIRISYDLYAWLLTNGEKVTLRAYLTNFVDPVDVPHQFSADLDVKKVSDTNKELVEIFWEVYKLFSATEKDVASSQELQGDLKAMYQEVANLKKRTRIQKEKLQNIVASESLISFGKMFYDANKQRSKIAKEISNNVDIIKHMERTLSDYSRLKKYGALKLDTLESSLRDASNTSKTLLNTSVKLEREKVARTRLMLEDTIKRGIENDQLAKQIESLKTEVQDLTNQKITLYSSADDKLGPFRKQATGVANRKEVLLEKVNNIRNQHILFTDQLKLKETQLCNTVGGEIYHGEKLKSFIAELRGKSVIYKRKRGKLQYWAAELTTLNRTSDVLCYIDPSLKDLPHQSSVTNQNQLITLKTNSIGEAKQMSKTLIPEIKAARALTSQTQSVLLGARKEISEVSERYELIKENFETTVMAIRAPIGNFKEQIQINKDQIEILERQWKGITRELEKLDQVFNQLVDDVLEDSPLRQTYRDQLEKKKKELKEGLEDLDRKLADFEDKKKEVLQKIKVYNNLQLILFAKLEQH